MSAQLKEDTKGRGQVLTLYFSRSSLLRGALMMLRRTLEGALKCALRDLRLEEWRAVKLCQYLNDNIDRCRKSTYLR